MWTAQNILNSQYTTIIQLAVMFELRSNVADLAIFNTISVSKSRGRNGCLERYGHAEPDDDICCRGVR
jgi:hypothetical protein